MNSKCVFCGNPASENHHIIPEEVRKLMGWKGKKTKYWGATYKILMCNHCHEVFHELIKSLTVIIKLLKKPLVPIELMFLMDEIILRLEKIEESESIPKTETKGTKNLTEVPSKEETEEKIEAS